MYKESKRCNEKNYVRKENETVYVVDKVKAEKGEY